MPKVVISSMDGAPDDALQRQSSWHSDAAVGTVHTITVLPEIPAAIAVIGPENISDPFSPELRTSPYY